VGLAQLINSGRPAFKARYRVVPVGNRLVIEFLEGEPTGSGQYPIQILPYQGGQIASVPQVPGGTISGEFTGCIMSVFTQGLGTRVGHVCTNPDTSCRDKYDLQKKNGQIKMISEYDTAGSVAGYPQHTGATRVLCLATGREIQRYFVER